MTDAPTPDTVVLIHGLWMTPLSWEKWIERFEGRGLKVLAPAWPGFDRPVEELRKDTSQIDNVGIEEILDNYTKIIEALDTPPIIMGHSFGGAFTQVLLDRGLGAAGVAVDPAPVKGILTLPASTLRVSYPILKNPANRHRAVMPTAEEFRYSFLNTIEDDAEAQAIYERYAVPGAGHVLFQGALANFNPHAALKVDFKKPDRAPLLLIAGGDDHVAPAVQTRANYKHYKHSEGLTAFKEFPGRSHYTVGQEGWEEVADFALDWALSPVALDADGAPEAATV
jgi:pimeloyl-ACP methyl ester carboxylesterase